MDAALPAPLVLAEVDLRDFPFMPLDVVRLRDSELSARVSGDEFRGAVLLWCASWHQVPAGSLPNDDVQLSQLAGLGRVVREWQKIKGGALHRWVLCSDGRYYHPIIAEKAIEAWKGKLKQRWITECNRIRQHNKRHGVDLPVPSYEQWKSGGCHMGQALPVTRDDDLLSRIQPRESGSNREGERKGQGDGQGQGSPSGKPSDDTPPGGERPTKPSRATRLSPDWKPDIDDIAYARERGCSEQMVQSEAEKFRDYWIAKPGKDGTKLDWPATWRSWIRNSLERFGGAQGRRPSPNRQQWAKTA